MLYVEKRTCIIRKEKIRKYPVTVTSFLLFCSHPRALFTISVQTKLESGQRCTGFRELSNLKGTCLLNQLNCRYNITFLLITYVFPIIIIGICTVHMTVVLWCRAPVGVLTPQINKAKKKKQKVMK